MSCNKCTDKKLLILNQVALEIKRYYISLLLLEKIHLIYCGTLMCLLLNSPNT